VLVETSIQVQFSEVRVFTWSLDLIFLVWIEVHGVSAGPTSDVTPRQATKSGKRKAAESPGGGWIGLLRHYESDESTIRIYLTFAPRLFAREITC
jgi:hypothetical protein